MVIFLIIVFFIFLPLQDCNKDGVTDCDDYARIHFNGREDCSAIDNTNFWRRYETCRPTSSRGESTHADPRCSVRFRYFYPYRQFFFLPNLTDGGGHRATCTDRGSTGWGYRSSHIYTYYYNQTYFWSFRRREILLRISPNTHTRTYYVYRRKYYISRTLQTSTWREAGIERLSRYDRDTTRTRGIRLLHTLRPKRFAILVHTLHYKLFYEYITTIILYIVTFTERNIWYLRSEDLHTYGSYVIYLST